MLESKTYSCNKEYIIQYKQLLNINICVSCDINYNNCMKKLKISI